MTLELDNFQTWSYIWGSFVFASSKAYSHLLGSISVPPILQMVMELKVIAKEEGFLLVSYKRQAKYQGSSKKKIYGSSKLQLCALSFKCERISTAPLSGLSICHGLLEQLCNASGPAHGVGATYVGIRLRFRSRFA